MWDVEGVERQDCSEDCLRIEGLAIILCVIVILGVLAQEY